MLKEYIVGIEMNIAAETPEEAARLAFGYILDEDVSPLEFDVREANKTVVKLTKEQLYR